jgi:hypothetical protein
MSAKWLSVLAYRRRPLTDRAGTLNENSRTHLCRWRQSDSGQIN